jgi:hypothetical protein
MPETPWTDPDADRNFRTVIPPALWEEYYASLGRFMHMFSRAEVDLNATLSNYLSQRLLPKSQFTDSFLLKAILGGQRVKPLIDTLKRALFVSTPHPNVASAQLLSQYEKRYLDVSNVLSQLSEIHFLRDRLAHNGASPDMANKDGWFCSNNIITVREYDDIDLIYFKPQTLLNAARDLTFIPDRLLWAIDPDLFATISAHPGVSDHVNDALAPWHYKPSQLRREGPKYHPNRKSRPRPPKSSRGSNPPDSE